MSDQTSDPTDAPAGPPPTETVEEHALPEVGLPEQTDNGPRDDDGDQPEQAPGEARTDLLPEED